MNLLTLLASAMGLNKLTSAVFSSTAFRQATPSKRFRDKAKFSMHGCPQSNKDDALPRGYPGAKLARKAAMNFAAVKHPRGLRQNGVTC
jgi:hypothetical protein